MSVPNTFEGRGVPLDVEELDENFAYLTQSGTWTPVLQFAVLGNLAVTYSQQVGTWNRVGDIVMVTFNILTASFTHTTSSGSLVVTGLPAAAYGATTPSNSFSLGQCFWGGITKANYTDVDVYIGNTTNTSLNFSISGSGQAPVDVAAGDVPSGGTVRLTGTIMYRGL